jgi:hypothetical protein
MEVNEDIQARLDSVSTCENCGSYYRFTSCTVDTWECNACSQEYFIKDLVIKHFGFTYIAVSLIDMFQKTSILHLSGFPLDEIKEMTLKEINENVEIVKGKL